MQTKEISVGEFDGLTGLTHITFQRGRLMFNMGPPSTKRVAVEASVDAPTEEIPPRDELHRQRVFRSGVFTGRSLYAEETVYLVQRGALVVYAMEEVDSEDVHASDDTRVPLTVAQLMAQIVRNRFVPWAVVDVYTFLKDNKLHPRRYVSTEPIVSSGLFLFDVFKTISETQYVAMDPDALDVTSDIKGKMRKRKVKRLARIFRVGVSSFQDVMPQPRELRRLMATGVDGDEAVPLKLAVADAGRSVLLFEIG